MVCLFSWNNKMPVETISGDLLESDAQYIIHQCNCVSKTYSGLAQYLFQKYPYANIYAERKDGKYVHLPEEIYIRGDADNRYVINATAQIFPGRPSNNRFLHWQDSVKDRKQFFYKCLLKVAGIENLKSIAFPYKIGCGLAGGDWSVYKRIIEKFSDHVEAKYKTQVFIVKRPEDS